MSRLAQLFRRTTQLGVIAFIAYTALGGPWRNFKLAHNHRRLVKLMEGDVWGFLYGLNEDLLTLAGDAYEMSLGFLGFPWAGRAFGIDMVDPVLALAHGARTLSAPASLAMSLVLPLGIAILLGKVFCSHLCPMRLLFEVGQLVRRGLLRLGAELPELGTRQRFGGWMLLGGLVASAGTGTIVWLLLLPYASLSAAIFLSITAGTTAGLIAVPLFWFVVDTSLAPGFFCHNVCPTGFLLEQLGRFSFLRLRKLGSEPCPTGCQTCRATCPYGLNPKHQTHRPACDNCGRCVVTCPSQRLARKVSLPVIGLAGLALWPAGAEAHHNKGLPHYGYFENYPQVPTEEYVAIRGRWEIGATLFNFQGYDRRSADTPNDVKIYMYLYDLKADRAYEGPVRVEIVQDGELVSRFDRVEVDEEAVYSTRETLPRSGDYELVAFVDEERVSLPFHVELNDGVSWLTIGGITLPVLLVFGLAVHGRRKKRRRRRRKLARASAALALLSTLVSPVARAQVQNHVHDDAATRQAEPCADCDDMSPAAIVPQPDVCPVCGMKGCTMEHYDSNDGGMVMVMGGIPTWLFLVGIGGVIVLSFVATEWIAPRTRRGFRVNLIKKRSVYKVFRSRWLQTIPQLSMVGLLGFLVYAGLFGSPIANITPVAVWTLWWAGLIFAVLMLGSAWCFVCPWDGLANLGSRLRAAARVDTLSLKLPYPRWLRNMYPAIGLFVVLTWLELGYGVTTDPKFTAYMGLGMAALAVIAALLWDGKKFCAHGCPVGRICGLYSNFSPIEIRARNPRTCQVCTTEDCLHGNDKGYPCPTGISLKTVQSATMCTACTECIKSCDKHNVALNLRPFGSDLRPTHTPQRDEAWLALMLLSLTLFHGLSMTSTWQSFAPGSTSILKWMSTTLGTPEVLNFTLGMAVACAIPVALYALSCWVSARWANDGTSAEHLFVRYAYSLLPVALFYHLAHNLMHLLMEGGSIVPLLSDPLGRGSDYLGTADMHVGSLVGDNVLWNLQVGLILIGHVYGIVVAHRIGHEVHRDKRTAIRSLIPIPVMMVAISVCGLWLMHLDMNMRVGRM